MAYRPARRRAKMFRGWMPALPTRQAGGSRALYLGDTTVRILPPGHPLTP